MFLLVSAALACGPYGAAADVFQPTDDISVTVMGDYLTVFDQSDDRFHDQTMRSDTIRRVEVRGDRLFVYGNRGLEIIDLGELEAA